MSIYRRHVFYIPGYEPRGPVFYEKLFRKHLLRFARLNRLKPRVSGTDIQTLYHRVVVNMDELELTYDILDNADVLQPHSRISRWKFYFLLVYFTPKAIRSILRPSCRHVQWAWMVALAPWLFVYVALASLCLVFAGSFWLLTSLGLTTLISAPVSLIPVTFLWRIFEKEYRHQNIARIFDSSRFFLDGKDPIQTQMAQRLDAFADLIEKQILESDADEYVIVGHSSGSVLASRVAAILVDRPSLKEQSLTLVCMGSVYQLELCSQTHFDAQSQVYQKLRDSQQLQWAEVFAAFDAFCPQRMNPCDEKLRPEEGSSRPIYRSANFKKNLNPDKFQKLRRNLLWIHMQYILSSDYAITFDYFKMLTGRAPVFAYLKNPEQCK